MAVFNIKNKQRNTEKSWIIETALPWSQRKEHLLAIGKPVPDYFEPLWSYWKSYKTEYEARQALEDKKCQNNGRMYRIVWAPVFEAK